MFSRAWHWLRAFPHLAGTVSFFPLFALNHWLHALGTDCLSLPCQILNRKMFSLTFAFQN